MPSSKLTGKSKEDLATIAVMSGLLNVEQAEAMTKPELLKFLKKAEKIAPQPVVDPLESSVAAHTPTKTLEKPARKQSTRTATKKTTSLTAESATDLASETAAGITNEPAHEPVPVKPARKSAKKIEKSTTKPEPQQAPQSELQPVPQPESPRVTETAVLAEPTTQPTPQPAAESAPIPTVAKASRPVERMTPPTNARHAVQHENRPNVRPARQPMVRPGPTQQSQPMQTRGNGRSATGSGPLDTSRGRPQNRGPARGKNTPSASQQQPSRPVRVKVFGIPANPMAAQSDEHESALLNAEKEQARQILAASIPATEQLDNDLVPKVSAHGPARSLKTPAAQMEATDQLEATVQSDQTGPENGESESFDRGSETGEPVVDKHSKKQIESGESITGVLEIMPDGYGFLRRDNYLQGAKDAYVPPQYIRRFNLRPGDLVTGPCKKQRDNDRYQALLYIKEVNGESPEKMLKRPYFDRLTPVYPDDRYILETSRNELSTRIIDLVAPIGKGQRAMIVSPPKAGKTILLQKIANAISTNNPEVKLIVLLIDERPEEVTDMQRSINGEVVYSTFDKTPENHVKVTELVLERAMRLVELQQDVVILLDSMTRLGRAYNLTITPTGRTLSGGLDPGALYGPKRFFGAARNIENGGSLTIIATSLIETGSRMDEVIFEEFKGTGNMEVLLDRKLSEKRIFPAIDINKSGTRREELLLTTKELDAVWTIRKAFGQLDTAAVTETIINLLLKTQDNQQFISSINVSFNDKNVFDAMRGTRPTSNNGGTGAGGQRRGGTGYERDND